MKGIRKKIMRKKIKNIESIVLITKKKKIKIKLIVLIEKKIKIMI